MSPLHRLQRFFAVIGYFHAMSANFQQSDRYFLIDQAVFSQQNVQRADIFPVRINIQR